MRSGGSRKSLPPQPDERIWRYVAVVDAGTAPCVDASLLTLCICKPRIRRSAQIGDWVIGWTPARTCKGRIVWVGQVDTSKTSGVEGRGLIL